MAWIAITNAEIDPESPGTTTLFTKYRDNQEALYDGRFFVRKLANEGPLGAGLQDDDDLALPMLVNQLWHWELVLLVTVAGGGFDLQFDFTVPAAATFMAAYSAARGAVFEQTGFTTGVATTINYTAAPTNMPIFMHGWVNTIGTAGDFQLQWAAIGGSGVTALAGSYLAAYQDPSTM